MRGIYTGFEAYRAPLELNYEDILTQSLIVLDANVLLNLYRYTPTASEDFLAVLDTLADNLWVPHQVMVEFWLNRHNVILEARQSSAAAPREMGRHRDAAQVTLEKWAERSGISTTALKPLLSSLNEAFLVIDKSMKEKTDATKAVRVIPTANDPLLTRLDLLLRGHIGNPMDPATHQAARTEGDYRLGHGQPPGYMDSGKKYNAIGDYLVWEQTLLQAVSTHKPVLLVTGDMKEDWWMIHDTKPVGPRNELAAELYARNGQQLYMLTPVDLMRHAKTFNDVDVDAQSLENIREVTEDPADATKGLCKTICTFVSELQRKSVLAAAVLVSAAIRGGVIWLDEILELTPDGTEVSTALYELSTVDYKVNSTNTFSGLYIYGLLEDAQDRHGRFMGFRIPESVRDEVVKCITRCFSLDDNNVPRVNMMYNWTS